MQNLLDGAKLEFLLSKAYWLLRIVEGYHYNPQAANEEVWSTIGDYLTMLDTLDRSVFQKGIAYHSIHEEIKRRSK